MKRKIIFPVVLCAFALSGCKLINSLENLMPFDEFSTINEDSTDIDMTSFEDGDMADMYTYDSSYGMDSGKCENGYFGIIYDQLDENEKLVYDDIINGMREFKPCIILSKPLKPDSLNKVYEAVCCTDRLHLYCDTNEYVYKYHKEKNTSPAIIPVYMYTKEEARQLEAAVEEAADKIISKITEDMSDRKKLLVLHDSLVDMCSYDYSSMNTSTQKDVHHHDAYGAMVEKKAVCDGYSKAFKYLCEKVGIECELVQGNAGGNYDIGHMWNIVCIDGKWSYIDVTFDDSDDTGVINHDYFIINDKTLLRDHEINSVFAYPECK